MKLGRHIFKALLAGLALVLVALAAGCGRETEPDLINGKTLFVEKCGRCHMLDRAGTKGVQGPSLDSAFGAARRAGIDEETIAGVTGQQISRVRRGSIMPLNLVTGQDAEDVAAYVGLSAGVPGKDTGELANAGKPEVSSKPIAAKGSTLTMPADPTGALAFASTKATAGAGKVEFVMPNPSSVEHNIAVRNGGSKGAGPVVGKGGRSSFSASLKAGKFVYFCSVPGHEAGGMKGELSVK
ncbi:MAG: c-type cytochrome [Thermoleophilaceae bacterium]